MYINEKAQLDKEDVTVLTVAGSVSANFAKKLFPEAKKISLKNDLYVTRKTYLLKTRNYI